MHLPLLCPASGGNAVENHVGTPISLCALEELPVGLGRAFNIGGRLIAVFRTRKGKIFALDNRCPHRGGPLAEGMLAGDQIVCPLHAFRFDGATGECDQPSACSIETFPVNIHGNQVRIFLTPDQKNYRQPA